MGTVSYGVLLAYRAWRRSSRVSESVRPGINAPFSCAGDGSEFLARFEIESREIFVKATQVLEALRIEPGMKVADLGAGTGLFMEPLADQT